MLGNFGRQTRLPDEDEVPAPGFLAAWRWRELITKAFPHRLKLPENELLAKAPVGRSPTRKLLTSGAFFSVQHLSLYASKEKTLAVGDEGISLM